MELQKRMATASLPSIFFILNFIAGMAFSAVGAILPDMTLLFGLTNSQVSSIPQIQFLGTFLALLFLGFMRARVRPILIGSSAAMALSSLALFRMPSYSAGMKAAFFFFGASSQIGVVLPGMVIAKLHGVKTARSMNIAYSFFSAGVTAGPLLFGALAARGLHYPALFAIFVLLCAVSGVLASFSPLPREPLERGLEPRVVKELLRAEGVFFILCFAMIALYAAAESVPNIWIPQYFSETFEGYTGFRSRLALTFFWGAVTVGRQVCAVLIHRGARPRHLLVALTCGAAAALFFAPAVKNPLSAVALFAASGLFFSAIFPILLSFSEHFDGRHRNSFFILAMSAGNIGVSLTSAVTGRLAERYGFFTSIALGPVFLVMILILALVTGSLLLQEGEGAAGG